MAESRIIDTSIDAAGDWKDTVTFTYLVDLGAVVVNPMVALQQAHSLGPDPVPNRRARLNGTLLFANSINGTRTGERQDTWKFVVTYSPPPDGEDEEQQNENPLLRPAVYGIGYVDEEYVVQEARNVEVLGTEFAAGGPLRPAGTLAPIKNSAGRRPDEPIVRTRRRPVIRIARNYASLGEILSLNEDWQDTTNSDEITLGSKTFEARRLKYELTQEGGKQEENGVTYYPGVTEIGIYKTTDLVFDNVGFDYYNTSGNLTRALDADGEPTAEPVNLTMAGTKSETPTTITYRDLAEVAYAGFFS